MPTYSHYVFDAYGTLFDVHSAASKFAGEIGPDWERLSQVWRAKHLEYTWIWAGTGRHTTFWKLASDSLDTAIETVFPGRSGAGPDAGFPGRSGAGPDAGFPGRSGVGPDAGFPGRSGAGPDAGFPGRSGAGPDAAGGIPPGVRDKLLAAYRTLDAYPEVAGVLGQLKARGAKLAILTNGDPDMIADAVSSAKLDGVFDALITVHEAGVFKPHRPVYDLVSKHFGVPLDKVSFQSSNRWDVTAGKVAGMRGVWVNRTGAPAEYPDTPPDLVLRDLAPLAL